MNIIHPESLSFWTLIVFVCLLLLLRAFAWKPILKALKERETSINNALEDAILKEAREIKERIVSQAKEEAHQEGAKLIAHAKTSIENEKKMAIAEIKQQIATLSLDIAKKVLTKELAAEVKQEKLVESLLNEINIK